jgi:hypothetical protein
MAKKKVKHKDDSFEENLRWFFAIAYLADCVGLLNQTKKLKLAHLNEQYGFETSWQQKVGEELGMDPAFVKSVYMLCTDRGMTEAQAILFMLQGIGCPEAERRMMEVLD